VGTTTTDGSTTTTTVAPVNLATVNTDATGVFQTSLAIPASTAPGSYLIVVSDSSGVDRATAALTVTASGATATTSGTVASLSATGTDARHSVAVSLGLVGLGLLLLAMAWPSEKNRFHRRFSRTR